MNTQMWMGGLVLSLGGWMGTAAAQEVIWRPSARPAELQPPAHLVELPTPSATIGRPVPLPATSAGFDSGLVQAGYREPSAPIPVPRTEADAGDDPDIVGQFASFRAPVKTIGYAGEPIAVTPQAGPAAPQILPPAPPLSAMDAPMPEEEEGDGLFADLASLTPRFYARGEYLLWWFKNDTVPALVTTSAPADMGFLTGPTTRTLFGGDGLSSGSHSGGRFTAGVWLNDCETKAVEVSGFFLPGGERRFDANSANFAVLARPFFNLNRNQEFAQLTAFPGVSTGNIAVTNSSDLWGVEANLRCCLCAGCAPCDECDSWYAGWGYHLDGLVGFRYLNLNEDLSITETGVNLPTAPQNPNTAFSVFDDFAARNRFYGAQVGLDAEVARGGPWSVDVLGKVALGDTNQHININGGQRVTNLATGVTTPFQGGLLALPSNIGSHNRNAFSVVPEINVTLNYQITDHWRVFAGYDFLFWTNVVRPGGQIDRVLDETQIPNFDPPGTIAAAGQNRPAVPFRQSDFWAQGLNLGLEFRY
jgi:hypothetical protein